MKKAILLTLLTAAIALPLSAAEERERHQSYISYDEGGTVVRSAEDGKDIEAHRNLPVYPGDEVVTARRGRAEVHLSDGNIIGIDRASAIRFRSILDAYEGEDNETVAELRYGKVAVQRTDIGRDHVRLDTDNASYVANHESIYSVESDSRGRDRVTVFEGSIEVRTPARSTRLRAGDAASVDDRGVFDLVGDQRTSADDFERWFLKRAERAGSYTSKYMDRRLSHWNSDLDDHGRWVFATGIGWGWRPYVSVGWRPYYNGYWSHRRGCLTWVSYDPWSWGTYHYGRWAHDPFQGWFWVPGSGYSPAWVYWWYGPSYVGWAPSGWWDCHRGYYNWAYRPYRHHGARFGAGFYGRVRVSDMDLRPWTFVDSNTIVSGRIDRAALTTDAIKGRLTRDNSGFATIAGGPSRFTREQLRDPAESIRRRGLGSDAGIEAGTPADLTPFFRRDGQVAANVRDRIVRGSGSAPANAGSSNPRNIGGGSVAPIGSGSLAPIGRGSVAPIGSGSVAPIGAGTRPEANEGRINRGGGRVIGSEPAPERDASGSGNSRGAWRDRIDRPSAAPPSSTTSPAPAPETPRSGGSSDSWRRRVRSGDEPSASTPPPSASSSDETPSRGSGDVPRRVIDRIGGARIVPRERDSGSDSKPRETTRESAPPRDSGGSTTRDRGSRDSGSRDSGSSSSGGSVDRPSRPQSDSGGSSRSSNNSGSSKSSGGNRESGGKIKRDL
ncbi:MAG TPA: DUF6600 domain-containing protein [Thermoanaerobaculia bacterium]|nr:DUF6600 domain-containing protein [Thermoanaerobaculia bacterium]